MPTYTFRNKLTNKTFDKLLSMSQRQPFLDENPDLEQVLGSTLTVTGMNLKPDQGFRDVLKEIRSKHDKRFTRSTINTF